MSTLAEIAFSETTKWIVLAILAALASWAGVQREEIRKWAAKRAIKRQAMEAFASAAPSMLRQNEELRQGVAEVLRQVGEVRVQQAAHGGQLDELLALTHGQFDLSPEPMFVCDNSGRNLRVNAAYAQLLHTGRGELTGYGYKSFMPQPEQDRYMGRFLAAVAECRDFEDEISMWCGDNLVRLRVVLVPHPRDSDQPTHWVGTLVQLSGGC